LCWAHDYERTPALTPDELSDLVGRPRTTLYRHLGILENELGWLRVDRSGRRLILRPIVEVGRQPVPAARSLAKAPVDEELRQALESAGIENPARETQLTYPGQRKPETV
jgi:DNA-binding IclR family transcriptional regulator